MTEYETVMDEVIYGLRDVAEWEISPISSATAFPPAIRLGSGGVNYLFLPYFDADLQLCVEVYGFDAYGRRKLHMHCLLPKGGS